MSPATALPPPPHPPASLSLVPPLLPLPAGARPQFERPLPLLSPAQWSAMVQRQLADARRQRSGLAVLAVTVTELRRLDATGGVGELAGAGIADTVQLHITQRLRTRVRSSDRLARIGSSQLGLILTGIDARLAGEIQQRVTPALAGAFRVDEQLAMAQVRSGVAVFPDDGATAEALLACLSARVDPPAGPR